MEAKASKLLLNSSFHTLPATLSYFLQEAGMQLKTRPRKKIHFGILEVFQPFLVALNHALNIPLLWLTDLGVLEEPDLFTVAVREGERG